MAKKFLKRYLPHPDKIRNNKYLKIFGKWLHDPNLWHLNRHSVATALSVGLFACYLPFPGHMLTAAALCILFRANLPIAVALVWVSNPFTIPPQFYFAYKLGSYVLGRKLGKFHFEPTVSWFLHEFNVIAAPLLVGSLICGLILALLGNIAVRLFWRYHVSQAWKARKNRQIVRDRSLM